MTIQKNESHSNCKSNFIFILYKVYNQKQLMKSSLPKNHYQIILFFVTKWEKTGFLKVISEYAEAV